MGSQSDKKNHVALVASLAGVEMAVYREESLNVVISDHIESHTRSKLYCTHHNMHSLALAHCHEKMRSYQKMSSVHWIDGMPLVWMLCLLGFSIDRRWRVTFLDWQYSFFDLCAKRNYKVFLIGSEPKDIQSAANAIQRAHPNLNIGFHHGYLSNQPDNSSAIKRENDFAPDILIVGMGMPLQEQWILENGAKTRAKVVMPIGGFFDYLAGKTYSPPRWTGKIGLEWLARLISSPRRLAYRYLIEPWPVICRFIIEVSKKRFLGN